MLRSIYNRHAHICTSIHINQSIASWWFTYRSSVALCYDYYHRSVFSSRCLSVPVSYQSLQLKPWKSDGVTNDWNLACNLHITGNCYTNIYKWQALVTYKGKDTCFVVVHCRSVRATVHFQKRKATSTRAKLNIATENVWLEDYFPFGKVTFQGLCWTSGVYISALNLKDIKEMEHIFDLSNAWIWKCPPQNTHSNNLHHPTTTDIFIPKKHRLSYQQLQQ